jgi:hypothetical protein
MPPPPPGVTGKKASLTKGSHGPIVGKGKGKAKDPIEVLDDEPSVDRYGMWADVFGPSTVVSAYTAG